MAKNVETKSKPNENPLSLIRRFSRSVQQANVINRVKGAAYKGKNESAYEKKKKKLHGLAKKKEYERLYKLGKLTNKKGRKGHRR
jgi:hypothetical protein